MQKLRKSMEDKLKKDGLVLEKYLETLYKESFSKPLRDTFKKDQSYLQVPLGEAKFLEFLIRIKRPKNVLEIGTFRGFSTVFLAKETDGRITTIERDKNRYDDIEKLFKKTQVENKITLIKDFALPALEKLAKEGKGFDLFFIDASKKETIDYFKICYNKLANDGAIIVVDNTLWAGEVVKKRPSSNSASYMKQFNEFVFKKYKNKSYILPAWDGLTIVVK